MFSCCRKTKVDVAKPFPIDEYILALSVNNFSEAVNILKKNSKIPPFCIHIAARYGCIEAIQILLEKEVNINYILPTPKPKYTERKDALEIKEDADREYAHEVIEQFKSLHDKLISRHDALGDYHVFLSSTPLHFACSYNHIDTIGFLLKHDANINLINIERRSPIFYANSLEVLNLLLKADASIDITDVYGRDCCDEFKHQASFRALIARTSLSRFSSEASQDLRKSLVFKEMENVSRNYKDVKDSTDC